MVTQYRPLEKKKQARSLKLNVDLLFSWFIEHNKLYSYFEDSNYIRSPFTTQPSSKISTNPTQNEITLKGS